MRDEPVNQSEYILTRDHGAVKGLPRIVWLGTLLFSLLNAALRQMHWDGPELDADTWSATLLERLSDVDWTQARNDVLPFLEKPTDVEYVSYDSISEVLRTRRRR